MRIASMLCMLMIVSPVWAGTLTDNFNDPNMDEWINSAAKWEVDKGELVLGPGTGGFLIGEPVWKDYTAGARVKLAEHQKVDGWTQGAMLSVRVTGAGEAYRFGIGTFGQGPKQALAYRADGGVVMRVESVPFEWELNTFYDLRINVEGNVLKYYIDDKLVVEFTDNTYPAGGIAPTLIDKNSTVTARFDDFYVTGDDVPDMNVAVAPKAKLATTWANLKG